MPVALASLAGKPGARIVDAELEAEDGCLIWSFDVRMKDVSGIQEIKVDAGTGKVLSSTHETPKNEAAETVQDAMEAKKN